VGRTILHYEILEKLGAGGMGVVYKALDTKLDRPVALKFLAENLIPDPESKARFIHEARAASKLDHPNICTIHEIEESPDGQTFICMAWCDGETLQRRIEGGAVAVEEALDIAMQVAVGLEEAHAALIVHRDIKPSNIMISSKGQAKIMDFGLAKLADTTRLTRSAATVGTVQYMSPEQVKGEDVDHRTDIWSLGVVLYELLAGRLPFSGDYEATVLYAIVNEDFEPASRINAAVPAAIDEILAKALKKDPRERYASARELRDDLLEAKQSLAAGKGGARASPRRIKTVRMTRRASLVLCAAVVLLAAAAFVFSIFFKAAPKPVAVAVLGYGGTHPDTSYANYLAELLAMDLGQNPYVRPLSKDRIIDLCKSLKIDDLNDSTAFTLCDSASVGTLVVPRLARSGGALKLTVSVYDVPSRSWRCEVSQPVAGGRDVRFETIDRLSDALSRKWDVAPQGRGTVPPPSLARAATTESGQALLSFLQGEAIYRGVNPVEAIPHFATAVEFDSTFVRALLRLALWYDYAGDKKRAMILARKAKECSHGDRTEHMRAMSVEFRIRGDYEQAVTYMRSQLDVDPGDVRTRLDLGYVLYRFLKRFPEAISELNEIFTSDPQNGQGCWGKAYGCLGNIYLYTGQFDDAMNAFQKYAELYPGTPDALHDFASVYCYRGDYSEAILRYKEVIRLAPNFFPAYEDLGSTYAALGKCGAALEPFERYIEGVSEVTMKSNGHVLIGKVCLLQGKRRQAQREIEEAMKLDSLSLKARWLRGRIALGDRAGIAAARRDLRAMKTILERVGTSSDEAYYHDLLGRTLIAEKRYEEGLAEFRAAQRTASFHREYFDFQKDFVMGCIEAGKTREAIEEGLNLLAYNGNDGEVLSLLGLAYEREGSMDQARDCFQKAKVVWREAEPGFRPLAFVKSELNRI
jgi:tetratricopeptide (TPR) repeat protein